MIDFLMINITNGILIILLITVLILFCLYMYTDNKKLKEQNEELRKENKSLLENKIIRQDNIDSVSIKNISTEKAIDEYREYESVKQPSITMEVNNKLENNQVNLNENNNDIKDNLLETKISKNLDNNLNNNPSSVFDLDKFSNSSKEHDYTYYNPDNINTNSTKNFNLNELIYQNPSSLNNNLINKEVKIVKEYDFLQDISNKLTEELKPQTIKLTEYEQKQEDQAVISYKELLKAKDNNYLIDEKQDTIKFIEELKNLRNSLK